MNESKKREPRSWERWRVAGAIGTMLTAITSTVDNRSRVDYSSSQVPYTYKCDTCGALGVKLWRKYDARPDHQTLLCAKCAGEEQGKDVSSMDSKGMRTSEFGDKTDQIGWRVPAVPTEENDTFWGYTSVPEAGVNWWKHLPTHP